ncbi:P-loop NTPase [Hymenobacter cellulosivorans]|uniref:SIR2 family protein n=1 Tax=Hymenobacter cellulosivorans TaxID=2932249 RepID=A0ABY4F472_9BACT|nr:SIR2 family protein [Hymenobacter cellulosivorans]UOQ50868.1 SIR2 family protein [Hymenobacter cellulosivorans]
MKIFNKGALITAARVAKKPIAFLVGAPISNENGIGVPGVSEILDCIRQEILETAAWELDNFEAEISGKSGSDAYQAAMVWVQGYLLQDAVNNVIRRAVLQARKPKSTKEFNEDGVPEDWDIPSGIHQLAWLVCQYKEQFPGPLMTTNFDPLLSLAVIANGGNPILRVILTDGNLTHNVKQAGQTEVIHLHGYWRGTDTMHTPGQLTAPRPRLKESLKSILHKHTLVVVAYGGWDDIFAAALAEAVQDNATDINVLWCFRGDNIEDIQRSNPALFSRISPLLISGRFNAYGGIDCHAIFEEIAANIANSKNYSSVALNNENVSPLLGWQLLTPLYLDSLDQLTSEEAVRYFDGAIPSLRHAASKDIPKRGDVKNIVSFLVEVSSTNDRSYLQLIRAAGGEGKTTMLLQVAVEIVRSGKWKVIWRNSSSEGLSLSDLEKLNKDHQWLIVADDADNIVDQLAEAANRIHELGLTHIHFLLAARDVDWRSAKGDKKPWGNGLLESQIVSCEVSALMMLN